jgi:outer membrane biosynthesis protein TonB
MKRVLALLLLVMSGAALAQTTGAVNPSPAPAQSPANEDVPPGGCMPIGLTSSGEIVFPIQCRELIERHRGEAVEQKPAAVEEKPVTAEQKPASVEQKPTAAEQKPAASEQKSATTEPKPAAAEQKPAAADQKPAAAEEQAVPKQSAAVAPESSQPATKPVEAVPLQRRAEHGPRERAQGPEGPEGCQHFRTYDPASGSYRGYDGRRRSCR